MQSTMMQFPLTLDLIFRRGTTLYPDQEIVTGGACGTHRYTYQEFGERVRQLAGALRELGVRPGDRVASFAWSHYRHLELYFAVPLVGAVLHTVNIRLFHEDLTYIINHAGDRLLFADRSLLATIQTLQPTLTTVEKIVWMKDGSDAPTGDALDYEALLASSAGGDPFVTVDEQDAAMLCYTSGTTGKPKGVLYSHRALVLHALGSGMVDSFAISQSDTVMAIVPMFHACGWGLPYANTLAGAKQVYPGVAPQSALLIRLLQKEAVTCAAAVPTIWMSLLPELQRGQHHFARLDRIVCGGAALPLGLIRAYHHLGLRFVHAWGMTETAPIGTVSRLKPKLAQLSEDQQLAYQAKQGLAMPGIELRIVDSDGQPVPWDGATMGDLLVRGLWVTGGYYDDPRSAEACTPDGWFRTSDVVTIDGDGYIEVVDRTKDLIRSGGEWISSVALEGALMAHPKVLEAAVVAVPHERWQERPLACVVPRPEARGSIGAAELAEHLRPRFAKWWLPDDYVFLDELPKTGVGKFDKKVLRTRYQDGVPAAVGAR